MRRRGGRGIGRVVKEKKTNKDASHRDLPLASGQKVVSITSACKTVSSAAEMGDYMSGWCKCTKKAKNESTYDSAKKESMSAEGLCGEEEAGGWDGLVSLHRRSAFIVIVGVYILFLHHRPLWPHSKSNDTTSLQKRR